MSSKQIKILLFIFIVLFILVLGPKVSSLIFRSRALPDALGFGSISPDQITRIEIKKGSDSVVLAKDNDVWKVASRAADVAKINGLSESIKNLTVGNVVSQNPENYNQFEVDDVSGLNLKIKATSETEYVIGKSGQVTDSFYVRKADDNNVYIAHGKLLSLLDVKADNWFDKTIVDIQKEDLQMIEVLGDKQFSIKKEDSSWSITYLGKSTKLPSTEADQIITVFNPLNGYHVASVQDIKMYEAAQTKSVLRLTAANQNGPIELTLVKSESDWFIKSIKNNELLKTAAYILDPIMNAWEKVK